MDSYCKKMDMPDLRLRIKSFVSSNFNNVLKIHPHCHQEIEILYYINGFAKQQVNEQFFTVGRGDIVIIGKDQLHSIYTYGGSKYEILVIMFDAANMFEMGHGDAEHNPLFSYDNSVTYNNPINTSSQRGKLILNCITEIHEELAKKECAYPLIVKSLLYRMTGFITRYRLFEVTNNDMKSIKVERQVINRTFDLIDRDYFSKISIKRASEESNLSVPHFCRLFKKVTGMTFYDYLTSYRVNRAERMLGSDKTMAEIAFDCGFGSVSSFIRNFKKYKKCTPSSYKKQIATQVINHILNN